MKIGLICGSPKPKRSGSRAALNELRRNLSPSAEVVEVSFSGSNPEDKHLLGLCACQTLVVACPVYVDGLPGHLLSCLEVLEHTLSIAPARVQMAYGVVNCGFYEAGQTAPALEMLAHWSRRAGLIWGGGLGLGGGGMLADESGLPMGKGPKKDMAKALRVLAHNLENGRSVEDAFAWPNLPRLAYQAAAQFGWRQSIKRNGLRAKDLDIRR